MSIVGQVFRGIKNLPRKMFGTRNDRILKRMSARLDEAAAFEDELRTLCSEGNDYDEAFARKLKDIPAPPEGDVEANEEYEKKIQELRIELCKPLRDRSDDLARRLRESSTPDPFLPEAFAIVREASRRAHNHRHFDCQLIGGQALYDGCVAEMRTGEGKTIVCHLSAYLKVSQGLKTHVVTVNDYLVKRDAEFAQPVFELLGYTVGYIQAQIDSGGREGIRLQAYECDITYGTASEFGFDYLRDNMKTRLEEQVQGRLDFVIIDEVDSILIDEARTPLIIAGPAQDDITRYPRANQVAKELVKRQASWDRKVKSTVAKYEGDTHGIPKLGDAMSILGFKETKRQGNATEETEQETDDEQDAALATLGPDFLTDDHVEAIQIFENNVLRIPPKDQYRRYFIVQQERKATSITHDGVTIAQELLDMGSLYSGANMEWPHLIENALRAYKTYQRDRDYVVKDGSIIIVDPFTGRLMHGRQWSDGLHQAVEAKENVQVKEETQTLATITIQNFFKLYKSMAGMTGTAMTEGEEFMKIYKLDCIEIPTNRPVNRIDHNDKMYRDTDEKYGAIVDEIHEIRRRGRPADPYVLADVLSALRPVLHNNGQDVSRIDEAISQFNSASPGDRGVTSFMCTVYDEVMGDMAVGRPVLVGTTSVENSEKLSKLLDRRYGIEHEVLNAKNHAREAEIVTKAGMQTVPEVGQDKTPLGNVTVATNMAGRGTDIKLSDGVVYPKCKVPAPTPEGEFHSALYPVGVTKCCISCNEYDPKTKCAHCYKPKLDPRFPELGRNVCPLNTPCGLHIIGTERHESRRIDNQLRGRSGRQGDPGSSRFSLSLQDDLLKLFMADWMLRWMEKIGFEAGASLEHKQLTKGIERAQRKVEERNFSIRKHLLEWDEPMDYQRKGFYSERQAILEERNLSELIFKTIDSEIEAVVEQFLSPRYAQQCISEWCRANIGITIDEDSVDVEDMEAAEKSIRSKAIDETYDQIRTSLGEYIDPDEPAANWDVGGLLHSTQRLFNVPLTQNQMRKMEPRDIEDVLLEAARDHYENLPLDGISIYLDPEFPREALADWAKMKFAIEISASDFGESSPAEVRNVLNERVRNQYRQREINYPVESCLDRATEEDTINTATAADYIVNWANAKFRVNWKIEEVQGRSKKEVYDKLVEINDAFLFGGQLESEISRALEHIETEARKENPQATAEDIRNAQIQAAKQRFGRAWHQRMFDHNEGELKDALFEQGRRMLRWELTQLEHYILLRIYDQAWKDHLLEMDHLQNAIKQRPLGGDQTHPQSQFAIEGREFYDQMWNRIATRVTDVIFKVRTGGSAEQAQQQRAMRMSHADATGAGFSSADQEAAMRAQGQQAKTETIRREAAKVGRNSPCPCGSGKKYKQCCGKNPAQ